MACSTAATVAGDTSDLPFRTRETVLTETPASRATSVIVQRSIASLLSGGEGLKTIPAFLALNTPPLPVALPDGGILARQAESVKLGCKPVGGAWNQVTALLDYGKLQR
jgi:hypothetical protein